MGYKLFTALQTVEYRDFASFEAESAGFGGYIGQWSIPFGLWWCWEVLEFEREGSISLSLLCRVLVEF